MISVVASVITAADIVGTVGWVWLKFPRSTVYAMKKHNPYVTTNVICDCHHVGVSPSACRAKVTSCQCSEAISSPRMNARAVMYRPSRLPVPMLSITMANMPAAARHMPKIQNGSDIMPARYCNPMSTGNPSATTRIVRCNDTLRYSTHTYTRQPSHSLMAV